MKENIKEIISILVSLVIVALTFSLVIKSAGGINDVTLIGKIILVIFFLLFWYFYKNLISLLFIINDERKKY